MTTMIRYTYQINYANGDPSDTSASFDNAISILNRDHGYDIVVQDDWDQDGPNAERKLIWDTEEDADNDSGQRSFAEIVREPLDA